MIKKILMALVALVLSLILCRMASDGKEVDTYIDSQYQQYCVEIGEMYGICPELLMAIIESESSGNPNATNGTCKGLMQVSEKWHKDRMERLGVKDIYEPYGNILVATDYLMELAEKHEDIGMVLMVYNGDSRAKDYWNGNANLSKYAEKNLNRSQELERAHGK
jgi:soluble lytic murein transglycosylase-like protein